MTMLTRDVRDRAVAALRQAHNEGRTVFTNGVAAQRGDGGIDGCACYIIAQEFGIELASLPRPSHRPGYVATWLGGGGEGGGEIYDGLEKLGIPYIFIFSKNDSTGSYAAVADVVATFDVLDEAEAITRDAASELVGA